MCNLKDLKCFPTGNATILQNEDSIIIENLSDQGRYLNPDFNPNINWWPIAAAIGLYVLDKVDYSYTHTSNSDGSSSSSHTVSWNGINSGGGGGLTTFDGVRFDADDLNYVSEEIIPKGVPLNELKYVQITARNYRSLEIIGVKTC